MRKDCIAIKRLVLPMAMTIGGILVCAAGASDDPLAARRAKLDQRPKKIFAHYMGCYPIGGGGISPGYARSKSKEGRHDSPSFERAFGGRGRGEPLLPDGVNGLTPEESADLDIRRAMRAGIDGFAFMAIAGGANNVFPVMDAMFKVAEEKDYPFEITWCLSGLDKSIEGIEYILKKHGKSPKLARRDGKPMMMGYQSAFSGIEGAREIFSKRYPDIRKDTPEERYTPEFLRLLREGYRDKLEKRFDTPMYFQFGFGALFYGMEGKPKAEMTWPEIIGILAEEFDAITAFHVQSGPEDYDAVARAVTGKGAEWGEPLMYQYENLLWLGYRARSFPLVPGGDAMRERWERARENDSTLIQFTTWNDYTEFTALAPTTETRYGLMDVTAYFVAWWKTGVPPRPERDKVYLIYPKYRHELSSYPFRTRVPWRNTESMNKIEVLTILTAPARVRLPGREEAWDAPAGLSWRQVPLTPGPVAAEVLRRNWYGRWQAALRLESPEPVTDRPYREQHSMVCVSSEDERHWREDFGEASSAPMKRGEYADGDGDGLPNWFEMYWFGNGVLDWASAGVADPGADSDGDGQTNLEEYRARTNPTLAAGYKPGFVWDFREVGTNFVAWNPEYDRFDTPVWFYANKYAETLPLTHGGYRMCERFGWYPDRGNKAVYAPSYNVPTNGPAGEFTRFWEGDPKKATSSRFQITVGSHGLQALGWRSPVTGNVRFKAKLAPLAAEKRTYPPATITVEREGAPQPLFKKEFAPHEGVEMETEPIAVKTGEMLYLVLDAAPGGARGFSLDLDAFTVALLQTP